jgi:hypothetical protein
MTLDGTRGRVGSWRCPRPTGGGSAELPPPSRERVRPPGSRPRHGVSITRSARSCAEFRTGAGVSAGAKRPREERIAGLRHCRSPSLTRGKILKAGSGQVLWERGIFIENLRACRFSWLLSVIRLLTWAGSWFLNELSAGFSHRFVLFFGGRVGCYRADGLTARRPRVGRSPIQRNRERLAATP